MRVTEQESILKKILEEIQNFQYVRAIGIGGSEADRTSDNKSDIDIYVFIEENISIIERENIIKNFSTKYEVGGEYFGPGDEFYVDKINKQLDVMYWNVDWFSNMLNNVWFKHYPSNGYTTAFLFTLKNLEIVFDRNNWLLNLQKSITTKYPQKLKENIIKRNVMLMKDKPFASYYEQIEKGIARNDVISINHRISAFLASYFDVIFAVNELLHPGEKRLIQYALNKCKYLPKDFEENINKLLVQPNNQTLTILEIIVENLKDLLNRNIHL